MLNRGTVFMWCTRVLEREQVAVVTFENMSTVLQAVDHNDTVHLYSEPVRLTGSATFSVSFKFRVTTRQF
jgi:hypothetical protein